MIKSRLLIIIAALYFCTGLLSAGANRSISSDREEHIGEGHHKMNHVAVFAGGTFILEKDKNYFSLGLDYMRILSESRTWAAGAFGEVIFAEHPEWLFGGLIYYHMKNKFFIRTGPGIEFVYHEKTGPSSGQTESKYQTEILYRIGVGYQYHSNHLILAPTIDLDLVRSADALVFGINIGLAF